MGYTIITVIFFIPSRKIGVIPRKPSFSFSVHLINCLRINAKNSRVCLESASGHYRFNPLISHLRNIPNFVHHLPFSNF